jgi:hypothetical protein
MRCIRLLVDFVVFDHRQYTGIGLTVTKPRRQFSAMHMNHSLGYHYT